jgi:7,8-dihydroneopterin aldolase/epimerase/oxygenase
MDASPTGRPADRIEIRGLHAFGRHGVFPHERRHGQTFVVDLTLELDLSVAAASDELGDTVDYGTLAQQVAEAVQTTRFDLIEALAGHLADLALVDPSVQAVEVRVAKPEAPLSVKAAVAVVLRRERRR